MRWSAVWIPAVLILHPALALAAPVPRSGSGYHIMPWGLLDGSGSRGYALNTRGGIDALDLRTGKLLWRHPGPARPLALTRDRLLVEVPVEAKRHAVRVVALDTRARGAVRLRSDPVVFPEWVSVGPSYNHAYTSQGFLDEGDLLMRWSAFAGWAGGVPPLAPVPDKRADGWVRVSLRTGQVTAVEAREVPGRLQEKARLTGRKASPTEDISFHAGGVAARVHLDRSGDKARVILTRKPLGAVTLKAGRSLRFHLGADGRTALVQELAEGAEHAWQAYSTETGKPLARLPRDSGRAYPAALGPRTYYAVQETVVVKPPYTAERRTLKAVDLGTGKVLWEHPLKPIEAPPPPP